MSTIGIGIGEEAGPVFRSIQQGSVNSDVVGYGRPGFFDSDEVPFPLRLSENPGNCLITDLFAGRIDAAVRGSLPSNSTLFALKKIAGVRDLERVALLELPSGTRFLLAPVGVDEGWSITQKLSLIQKGRELAKKLGLPDTVAVLSGGRLGDIGRHPAVDRSMADAELTARIGAAEHYEILIEEAVGHSGLIIAPDGIAGNLVFRTLTFLGGGVGHGAPVLNIDKIFVDTSRASPDYCNALILAEQLIKS